MNAENPWGDVWEEVLSQYADIARTAPRKKFDAMHELVMHIAKSEIGRRMCPCLSHEILVLAVRDNSHDYAPSVMITPRVEDCDVEIRFCRHLPGETTTCDYEAARCFVDDALNECFRVTNEGPKRGVALLCDVKAVFIETKVNGEQSMFVSIKADGATLASGIAGKDSHELYSFIVPNHVFDDILWAADARWLANTGEFSRNQGETKCLLTVGFRLTDGTERLLKFSSAAEEFDAPKDVSGFVYHMRQTIGEHIDANS